jgi:hypothetical protein
MGIETGQDLLLISLLRINFRNAGNIVTNFFFYGANVVCYKNPMRIMFWCVLGLWLGGLLAAGAETLQLNDGTAISGDVVSYTDNGIILRRDDDSYTDRLPWLKFSQASLKQLAQDPKVAPFVLPFIEPPPPPIVSQKQQIIVSEPARLQYFASASLFGGLFSSPVTLLVLLLIYAGNLFAAYEVAIFRYRPVGLVVGTSAALPIIGPAIFLSMIPPPVEAAVEEGAVQADGSPAPPAPAPEPHHYSLPHMAAPAAVVPAAPAPAASEPQEEIHIVAGGFSGEPPPPPETKTEIFQRGQFMFNRRFFETKFAGFFGIIRSEADRGKVLMVKIPATLLTVERISRITANDVHFEVVQGGQRQEIMVPFADIQQIQLKHTA